MTSGYFNYQTKFAKDRRSRDGFLANWWHIFLRDPRWVPPYFPVLRRELDPERNPHIARMDPIFAYTEALPKRVRGDPYQPGTWLKQGGPSAPVYELPVSASLILKDPRRNDGGAYLALFRCVNDIDSLKNFFNSLYKEVRKRGIKRLIGPTHISPHLGSGVLFNHWDMNPPLYTPYNPPYLPETIRSIMQPLTSANLFHLSVPTRPLPLNKRPAEITAFDPELLIDKHLDLMVAASSSWDNFPPPDQAETAFIFRWISHWPLYGWIARIEQRPVGFILVQPDLAPLMKATGGGRGLFSRLWLFVRGHRSARRGRILFAGVLPEMRGQGIGAQLLEAAYATSRELNWTTLTAGPVPEGSPGEKFLLHKGASSHQHFWQYQLVL